MQEAEVARSAKALGQDVAQHQGEEVRAREGAVFPPFAIGVAIAEGHLPVLAGDDVLLADDAAAEVTS